jgi:F-type H+-transporting ATPase subunit epsilon
MPVEVHVVTPEREVWSGDAEMLIARGVDGELGILQGHAPLLVQLAIGPLRIQRTGGEWMGAVVDGGFLHVSSEGGATRADVLATQAQLADEIDPAAARQRLEQLQGRAGDEDDETVQAEIAKATARLNLVGSVRGPTNSIEPQRVPRR